MTKKGPLKASREDEREMRIERDKMFMEMCSLLARRSECSRAQVGAMVVREGRILSVGYNGTAAGESRCNCSEEGGCVESVHAEMNAIAFAAKEGNRVGGCTLYCSLSPCLNCAMLIVASGIERVVYGERYRLSEGLDYLSRFITVSRCDSEVLQ